ncbi:MAG: hypothetical protein AB2657_08425, partial [Candidatus Thiodiazotropha endolucinida]
TSVQVVLYVGQNSMQIIGLGGSILGAIQHPYVWSAIPDYKINHTKSSVIDGPQYSYLYY